MLRLRPVHNDVLKDRSTFIFTLKKSCVECVTMIRTTTLQNAAIYRTIRPNIPDAVNLQQHRRDNLKSREGTSLVLAFRNRKT